MNSFQKTKITMIFYKPMRTRTRTLNSLQMTSYLNWNPMIYRNLMKNSNQLQATTLGRSQSVKIPMPLASCTTRLLVIRYAHSSPISRMTSTQTSTKLPVTLRSLRGHVFWQRSTVKIHFHLNRKLFAKKQRNTNESLNSMKKTL